MGSWEAWKLLWYQWRRSTWVRDIYHFWRKVDECGTRTYSLKSGFGRRPILVKCQGHEDAAAGHTSTNPPPRYPLGMEENFRFSKEWVVPYAWMGAPGNEGWKRDILTSWYVERHVWRPICSHCGPPQTENQESELMRKVSLEYCVLNSEAHDMSLSVWLRRHKFV